VYSFLNHIEGREAFIGMCLLVRGVEAIGDAAFVTASFTVIALEFPDSVATTFVRRCSGKNDNILILAIYNLFTSMETLC